MNYELKESEDVNMELPEKIYLQRNTTTDLYEELWPEWFESPSTEDDIEYIRSDKVIEWLLKKHFDFL